MIVDARGYGARCDACGTLGPLIAWTIDLAGKLSDECRDAAAMAGWTSEQTEPHWKRDLCPKCRVAKGAA